MVIFGIIGAGIAIALQDLFKEEIEIGSENSNVQLTDRTWLPRARVMRVPS